MILFISTGRLGNQIFQYSFLKSIKNKNEIVITFNFHSLKKIFNIKDLFFFNFFFRIPDKLIKFFYFFFNLLSLLKIITSISENEINSYKNTIKKKSLLPIKYIKEGFFQSEKYFNPKIVSFDLKKKYFIQSNKILNKIPKKYKKIFIHIRRGDYLKEVFANQKNISLPITYFKKSIKFFKQKYKHIYFIIVSDDTNYAKKYFSFLHNKIISTESDGTDMAIMINCDGGICSNSSFSWWGAYLIKKKKIILMPKYWYGWKVKKVYPENIYIKKAKVINF